MSGPRNIAPRFSRKLRAPLMLGAILCAVTGYGQEASPSPGPTAIQPPPKETFRIYLLMGQSNMAGRGSVEPEAQKPNPRVLVMTPDGTWTLAKDPLHEQVGRIAPGVGPGMSFATAMLAADPGATIGLVPCAVGGTPLKRWVKGGDLYNHAVERAKLAARAGVISGVLWHQGESDTDKQPWADSYGARLAKMIADLRQDLALPELPVVVGQLGEFLAPDRHPYADTVRAALKNIPSAVPRAGYADSAGLKDKGDKLHFTAEAQRELGSRYAEAMSHLQRP